jgi:hypothetical protein
VAWDVPPSAAGEAIALNIVAIGEAIALNIVAIGKGSALNIVAIVYDLFLDFSAGAPHVSVSS